MLKKIIREPLLHFLIIAVLFFAVYALMNPSTSDTQTIVVSEGRIAQIKNSYAAQWKREPLPKELEDAIYSFAINEMYILEAKALGLNQGDKVINRRLRQKMAFLLNDLASNKEPSEQELIAFYKDNDEKYRSSAKYGFKQIVISTDREESEVQSLLALQQQRIQQGLDPEGDLSLLPREVKLADKKQLRGKFGEKFAAALSTIKLDQWSEPIQSAFGFHFVFLKAREIATTKSFDVVRNAVLDDWQYNYGKDYQTQYEQALLERYQIDVEKSPAGEPTP
jgi:parvulin-like peptidyl-prolyl isomerase